ncbi:hypothetical protein BME01_06240 [Klebsiella pneumoniae]|nr:hypothetical protein BME03_02595 [Klebsiella pneumoniae]OVT94803.1 hypothetical protein BME01_06240 [Klebsiella pneumoniae]
MTMTLQVVNELIASLESAGELSIREQKFLKLAKAYQQLAAENVALKQAEFNLVRNIINDLGDTEFQYARVQTPATDRIVAGIKADAIDEAAVELDRVDTVASTRVIGFKLRELSQQLREGAK